MTKQGISVVNSTAEDPAWDLLHWKQSIFKQTLQPVFPPFFPSLRVLHHTPFEAKASRLIAGPEASGGMCGTFSVLSCRCCRRLRLTP